MRTSLPSPRKAAGVAAAVLSALACTAATANAGIVVGDGVTGAGTSFEVFAQHTFESFGTASFTNPAFPDRSGDVTCLRIRGENATMGVQTSVDPARYTVFHLQDRGFYPAYPLDRIRAGATTDTPPACPAPASVRGIYQIAEGDLLIAS